MKSCAFLDFLIVFFPLLCRYGGRGKQHNMKSQSFSVLCLMILFLTLCIVCVHRELSCLNFCIMAIDVNKISLEVYSCSPAHKGLRNFIMLM